MADALASPGPRYVRRFTLSERLLHWVHATAFFVLLASGLVLYLPALSGMVGRHSLRGITRGTVREDWALEHHAKWRAGSPQAPS